MEAPETNSLRCTAVPLPQSDIDALDQLRTVEGFAQEADRSSFERFRSDAFFRKGRDENDRRRAASSDELTLQLDAGDTRHLHVGNYAGRLVHMWRTQEIIRRSKRNGGISERPYQPVGRDENGCIIVDDRNYRDLRQDNWLSSAREMACLPGPPS
jgi:hypothetical protein